MKMNQIKERVKKETLMKNSLKHSIAFCLLMASISFAQAAGVKDTTLLLQKLESLEQKIKNDRCKTKSNRLFDEV